MDDVINWQFMQGLESWPDMEGLTWEIQVDNHLHQQVASLMQQFAKLLDFF